MLNHIPKDSVIHISQRKSVSLGAYGGGASVRYAQANKRIWKCVDCMKDVIDTKLWDCRKTCEIVDLLRGMESKQ